MIAVLNRPKNRRSAQKKIRLLLASSQTKRLDPDSGATWNRAARTVAPAADAMQSPIKH